MRDSLSNILVYNEKINSGYIQYGKSIKNFSFLIGLRAEDSKIIVNQLITNERNDQDYFKFFPTLNISYKFNKSESILIGFNRRISRPRARFLNPFFKDPVLQIFFKEIQT